MIPSHKCHMWIKATRAPALPVNYAPGLYTPGALILQSISRWPYQTFAPPILIRYSTDRSLCDVLSIQTTSRDFFKRVTSYNVCDARNFDRADGTTPGVGNEATSRPPSCDKTWVERIIRTSTHPRGHCLLVEIQSFAPGYTLGVSPTIMGFYIIKCG